MAKEQNVDTSERPKTLIIGVDVPDNTTKNIQIYFDEFLHLISSNNIEFQGSLFIKLRSIDKGYFFTKGKLEEIQALCEKEKFQELIISEQLSPLQDRNLTELLNCRIFDRTQLILEIFEKSAHSAEAKMQIEIALFQYRKSRVAGKGVHMSQQAGYKGNKGPGETAKERELRHLEEAVNRLRRELKELQKKRDTRAKQRITNQIPQICLVGYTNTGKSTILNQLTKADVLAADRLFATLDTTTRELYIEGKKKGVISDTVGFIQHLPHLLIEAFKSTLSELTHADLLLHIIDVSDPDWENHIAIVHDILIELNVQKEMLYVFNKIDTPEKLHAPADLRERYQPNICIAGRTKEGVLPLITFLHNWQKK